MMDPKVMYYSKEGFEALKQQLDTLENVERPKASQQLAEAKEKGDLKENSEYHIAKEHLYFIGMRIVELKNQLAYARVMREDEIDTSQVSILTKVTLRNPQTGKETVYQLVSEREANVKAGKISVDSPVGKGLLGKKKGETVTIQIPAGSISWEIVDIA